MALSRHVDRNGSVLAGLANELVREYGWCGRTVEVLRVFTETEQRMAFLAGGRRPDEIVTWLSPWVESSLTIDEIGSVIECGGLDPDPFAFLAHAGLLQSFLCTPDGRHRRIQGELAGGWLGDEYPLADEIEIIEVARAAIRGDEESSGDRQASTV